MYVRVRIRGLEMLVFRNVLRAYLMDDSYCLVDAIHHLRNFKLSLLGW